MKRPKLSRKDTAIIIFGLWLPALNASLLLTAALTRGPWWLTIGKTIDASCMCMLAFLAGMKFHRAAVAKRIGKGIRDGLKKNMEEMVSKMVQDMIDKGLLVPGPMVTGALKQIAANDTSRKVH